MADPEIGRSGKVFPPLLRCLAQRRKQQVAALFQAGDAVLSDSQLSRDTDLGELSSLAQFTQGHFFGNQFGRPFLDPGDAGQGPASRSFRLRLKPLRISCSLQPVQMPFEPIVCLADQRAVKPPGATSRLVSGNEQHSLARRVEGKGQAPHPICES